MKRLLREPLLQFLLIGAAFFLLYNALNRGRTDAPREIVISEARVQALAENFATVWMRPPTAAELKGLVDDYVTEEIFYREAIAMGLDQDDTVIRRRLRQKMEFISDNVADAAEPGDAELQAYLDRHADQFKVPATLTFRQVFLNAERRGVTARGDADKLLSALQAGRIRGDPAQAGDPTLLPESMTQASPQQIAGTFGQEFAAAIDAAPVGRWSGPIQSGYGLHLVRVDQRVAGKAPTLDEVRPAVLREWQTEQRGRQNAALLDALKRKYDVRVEGPAATLWAAPARGATK